MPDILNVAKQLGTSFKRFVKRFRQLDREMIADLYLKGDGIEVGALHTPLRVSKEARVRYVDRMPVADLRKQYPELRSRELVPVDILDDGEKLQTISDSTLDFVIANSFIEHCQNPVLAFSNFFRVLRVGGILYLAIPDMRYTFDADRPVTTLEHLMRDFQEGPEWSKKQHFEEWVRLVQKLEADDEVEKQVAALMRIDYSIHYHVWTQREMFEFIVALKQMVSFEVELVFRGDTECVFILKKRKPGSEMKN